MAGASPIEPIEDQRPPKRLSIATYLGIGLGGLIAFALGLLLWVTLSTVFKNTTELLNDKSRIFLDSLTSQTRQFLDTTEAPTEVVAREIAEGRVSPADNDQMMPLMRTLLASSPQVTALAFFDVDGTRVVSYREDGEVLANRHSWADQEGIQEAIDDIRSRRSLIWGEPVHDQAIGTFVNLRRPVFENGRFVGMVTAVINLQVLSRFLSELETEVGQNAFILYDRDYVLAHRNLIEPIEGLSNDRPLPKITEVGDPVLGAIWREGWENYKLEAGEGHADDRGAVDYIFLYQALDGYADAPWLIGSYFPEDIVGAQFERMIASGVISLIIFLLTIAATYVFGRVLRKPIAGLATAASAVRNLDLDNVKALPPSRFAELDDAGRAFNAMISALRTFSLYVPKSLVQRLMARGQAGGLASEVRDVTVLMTDIVGFTPRAEKMGAEETAAFLNHHLGLVTGCIEAEGGVVDKYMGDAVMALWGALEPEPEQAYHAVRAAMRIADAIARDNQDAEEPVHVRIGIHRGPVVAGNIGAVTRMNYTVVGDTVNMAQRLEALGKSLLPDSEVAILMSGETVQALTEDVPMRSLGHHNLRGRAAEAEIFTPDP